MIPLSLGEVAGIVGGQVVDGDPDLVVTGPAFLDSRTPEPGGLFVAFAGERVDGHEFAPGASRPGPRPCSAAGATGVPTVLVGDTEAALQELARVVLSRLRSSGERPTVTAITGSSGKTTVKDMLAAVLGRRAPTVATAGSFNNELGLPLTVLRATAETRHLVLEMGARGIGHLAALCAIAPPDVSLVLNVGKAHIGEFGSQENIARRQGRARRGPRRRTASPSSTPTTRWSSAMASRTRGRVTTFGHAAGADVRLGDVVLDDLGRPSFDLTHAGERRERVALRAARGAPGAQRGRGGGDGRWRPASTWAPCARACAPSSGSPAGAWRSGSAPTAWWCVNDAYNANPDSMRAALETLGRMGAARGPPYGRGPGRHARAGGEPRRRSTAPSGELARRARASTSWSSSATTRGRPYDALREAGWRPASTTVHVATRDEAIAVVARECRGPGRRARARPRASEGLRAARGRTDRRGGPPGESDPAGRWPLPASSRWSAPATPSGCSPGSATGS